MKPCPFCGGSAELSQSLHSVSDDFFSVSCSVCGCSLGDFRSLDAAEFCWNTRPSLVFVRIVDFLSSKKFAKLFKASCFSVKKRDKE